MIIRIGRSFLITFGCFSLILLLLCFTPIPFRVWYSMSSDKAGIHRPPECIIVLGGGGMPSETGLMRTWYAAKAANHFQQAFVIIALPGNSKDSSSSVNLMKKEMVFRGISPDRIIIEDSGTNTRSQALLVFEIVKKLNFQKLPPSIMTPGDKPNNATKPLISSGERLLPSILIVTSPEHLNRAVLSFKKTGFSRIDGLPAFDYTIESDITFIDQQLGGRKWLPDMGRNITVRYQFWSQLRYEELIIREFFATTYYWIKGWI